MRRLAIETASMMQSVALEEDGLLVDSSLHLQTAGHARGLADTVAQLLARRGWQADSLDELIVGAGPGSFTGLRIGLSFAKGLAFSSGARIRNVPSIAAIAAVLPAGGRLIYATEARRNEVYGGVLSTGPAVAELVAVGAYAPAAFASAAAAFAAGSWRAGNGAVRYPEFFASIGAGSMQLEASFDQPTAAGLLAYLRTHDVELVEPAMVEPAYVRPHTSAEQRTAALTAQSGPVGTG